jgi:serine phosphatase RsbU (regulator of sigma subunit)
MRAIRRWLTSTFAGRALLVGAVIKLAALLAGVVAGAASWPASLDTVGDVVLVFGGVLLALRLYIDVKDVLLWRVRRKLTLSYIFIGFVPVLLIIILFSVTGLILFFNISQYVATGGVTTLINHASFLAESAAVGLQGATSNEEIVDRLRRRQSGAQRTFPYVSYAIVPSRGTCSSVQRSPILDRVVTAGPWTHMDPPAVLPSWIPCTGAAELVIYLSPAGGDNSGVAHIAARAVAWPDDPELPFAVLVDVPFSSSLIRAIHEETGIEIGDVSTLEGCEAAPLRGRQFESASTLSRSSGGTALNPLTAPRRWVSFLEYVDWNTGASCGAHMQIGMTVADLYSRISATPVAASRDGWDIGQLLLYILAFVGVLFLTIQLVAFIMGLALARSITGAVHELAVGTERVRSGDFSYAIPIRSRDQLGDLAESFNSMSASVRDLLQQKAEKERLEQELRIARQIQMSLLPQARISMPGLQLDAHCEPAREVGGDYYDYFPLADGRLGLLVADVAGKGTSAALYMAELKGLMLSLTQHEESPRRLLMEANRILSRHLDTRSFITITYGVVDIQARTLTYARAGHCPLIYVPGPYAETRVARVLAPDGLVLGLQIDSGERFDALLQEVTLPLGAGDVMLFYTDGVTEAMDPEGDCFGDARLAAVVQEHADEPVEEIRQRILREVRVFTGSAVQHDDLTMLLLKVEGIGAELRDSNTQAAASSMSDAAAPAPVGWS